MMAIFIGMFVLASLVICAVSIGVREFGDALGYFVLSLLLGTWLCIAITYCSPNIVYVRLQTVRVQHMKVEGQTVSQYIDLGSVTEPKRENITKKFGEIYPENSIVEVAGYPNWSCGIYFGIGDVVNRVILPNAENFKEIEKRVK